MLSSTQKARAAESIGLSYFIASRFCHSYNFLNKDDASAEALLGLTVAAEKWDEQIGVPYTKFASAGIKFRMLEFLRQERKHVIGVESIYQEEEGGDVAVSSAFSCLDSVAGLEAIEWQMVVKSFLQTLSARDAFILVEKMFGKSQKQIAEKYSAKFSCKQNQSQVAQRLKSLKRQFVAFSHENE